jgi:small redox-active disulfide protein 2
MIVKILGSGCANCNKLEEATREAVAELGLDAEVVKVTEFEDIMSYGIMSTPALVVDEEVKIAGRVPSLDEIKTALGR